MIVSDDKLGHEREKNYFGHEREKNYGHEHEKNYAKKRT